MVVTPDGRASVQAGAGIVADSDPQSEDEECAHKAGALLVAVTAARRMGARRRRAVGGRVSGLEAETAALRRGAGAFRPARDVLAVRGPDAEAYLQGQLSQDVSALAVGASADSLLLEPDGKLSALLRVTRTDGQGFVLDVDGGYGDAVVARLRRFVLRSKVEMEPLAWRCLSLRGAGGGRGGGRPAGRAGRTGRAGRCPSSGTAGRGRTCSAPRTSCSARRRRTCPPASWPAGPRRSRPAASSRGSPPWARS